MINKLNEHYSFTSPASVYDEEALTALELAGRTSAKINEVIDDQNLLRNQTELSMQEQNSAIKKMNDVTMPSLVDEKIQDNIDDGTFDNAINKYANNLEERVDNLLGSMTEGSTTMDAEIIDARIGLNGESFTTLGGAVRDKVKYTLLFKDYNNLYNKKGLSFEYNGTTTYYGLPTQQFTLPAGEYYIFFSDVNMLNVLLEHANGNRVTTIRRPKSHTPYDFTVSSSNESSPIKIYGYASNDKPNVAGIYTTGDIFIFKKEELPYINGAFVNELSIARLMESEASVIEHINYFTSSYDGVGTYNSANLGEVKLLAGTYQLLIKNSNYVSITIYHSEDTTYRGFHYAGDLSDKHLRFTIPENKQGYYTISMNHSLAEPNTAGDYYVEDLIIYDNGQILPDYVFDGTQLKRDVETLKSSVDTVYNKGVNVTTSINTGDTLTLSNFPSNLRKNVSLSFKANFSSFTDMLIGFGDHTYTSVWFKVDSTNITLYTYTTSESIVTTKAHGLSINEMVSVVVRLNEKGCISITLMTKSGSFTYENTSEYIGCGLPFVKSSNAMTDVVFNAITNEIKHDLWWFGDSYSGHNLIRVVGNIINIGFDNFLMCSLSGGNSGTLYTDLEKCMSMGKPKTIVWTLGMNDGSANLTIYQNYLDKVIELCKNNGIELICAVVPTVPTVNNESKRTYLLSKGVRVTDWYNAVGSSSTGSWFNGMLSGDNVHPTELGARALAMQTLIDIPELMR